MIAAAADPAAGDNLILNFSLPAASIYRNKPVASVVIPVRAWFVICSDWGHITYIEVFNSINGWFKTKKVIRKAFMGTHQ